MLSKNNNNNNNAISNVKVAFSQLTKKNTWMLLDYLKPSEIKRSSSIGKNSRVGFSQKLHRWQKKRKKKKQV